MTDQQTTELSFDVDAALISELGERLVARRSVALAELIKNAYDADATMVIVSFKNVASSGGEIVVTDDGSGMTLQAMRSGWMRVATTDAAVNNRSKRFGRPRTGAKGVGRFACGRLASRLALRSVAHASAGYERISAGFDWSDFIPGIDLADVRTTVTRELVEDKVSTGTELRLSSLADTWASKDLSELRVGLGDLVNPYTRKGSVHRSPDFEPDPGIEILIETPEFPEHEGELHDRFFEAAWGVLNGKVGDQGQPQYELDASKSKDVLHFCPPDTSFDNLSGAEFTLRMMVYTGGRFSGSGYSLREARSLGRNRGGVKVYFDGFQVFSYGEPGDDWLDLDQDRARRQVTTPGFLSEEAEGLARPMLSLPGNMQLFGAVSISREKTPELIISTSRERLVQNSSFEELKKFVRDGINWMTVCYAREAAKSDAETSENASSDPSAIDLLGSVLDRVRQEDVIKGAAKNEIAATITQAIRIIRVERSSQLSELSMLRILASAGTTVVLFDHTLRAMAGQLTDFAGRLATASDYLPSARRSRFEETLDDLNSWSTMAVGQGSLVGLLLSPNSRSRARSLAVRPLVEAMQRGFSGYTTRFGIHLENAVPPAVRTPPLHEAEIYAVLINILTNAFKAVRDVTDRRVLVEATVASGQVCIKVHDTGIGVIPEDRDRAFEPFFTKSNPDPVLGVGTGLGLKIVRDLVTAWGGNVGFIDAVAPWHTTIEIILPTEG